MSARLSLCNLMRTDIASELQGSAIAERFTCVVPPMARSCVSIIDELLSALQSNTLAAEVSSDLVECFSLHQFAGWQDKLSAPHLAAFAAYLSLEHMALRDDEPSPLADCLTLLRLKCVVAPRVVAALACALDELIDSTSGEDDSLRLVIVRTSDALHAGADRAPTAIEPEEISTEQLLREVEDVCGTPSEVREWARLVARELMND